MAKLLCTECGYEFNDNLASCPECGNPASECKTVETAPDKPNPEQATAQTDVPASAPISSPKGTLHNCSECGSPISFDAKHCPHCGAKGLYAPLDFGTSIYDCFCRKYAKFSGRSRRSEVFPFLIFVVGLTVLISSGYPKLGAIVSLVTLIPWFAAIARRLHDIGRNGWWAICPVIPWIFMCRDSDKQTNEYGRSPKYDLNFVAEELPDRGTDIATWCLIAIAIVAILSALIFAAFMNAMSGSIADVLNG